MSRTLTRRPVVVTSAIIGACSLAFAGAMPAHADSDVVYSWVASDSYYVVGEVSTTDAAVSVNSADFGIGWFPRGTERDETTTYSLMDYFFRADGGEEMFAGSAPASTDVAALVPSGGVYLVSWGNDTGSGVEGDWGTDYYEEELVYDEAFVADATAELLDVWAMDIDTDGRLLTLAYFVVTPDAGEPYDAYYIAVVDPAGPTLEPIVDVSEVSDLYGPISGIATDPTTGITYLLVFGEGLGYVSVDLATGDYEDPIGLPGYSDVAQTEPGDLDFDTDGTGYLLTYSNELLSISAPFGGDSTFAVIGAVDNLLSPSAISTPLPVEEELAATGVSLDLPLVVGFAAVGLGAVTLLAVRRRQEA